MTDGLIAFLNARLDEDEAWARQAAQVAGPDWTWKTEVPEGCDYPTDYVTSPSGALLLDTMGGIEGEAPHVARHDPARVLREVKAKRVIIAVHGPDPLNRFGSAHDPLCLVCLTVREGYEELWEADPWPCLTLRAIAAVWSDHADYRQEWKP